MLRRLRIENFVLIQEAELVFGPSLNAVTGETGAGKTILTQALGLLLGAAGDASYVGPAGSEAYVEAELDLPFALLTEGALAALADLRPDGEEGLVAARRVFADGRTRAYAWGRTVAREDLATAVEQLLAMSGQFEQRRLGRPSYQLELLDAFAGPEQQHRCEQAVQAWRELAAARRRRSEAEAQAGGAAERLAELAALVADTEALEPGTETELQAQRERLRHLEELAEAAFAAVEELSPESADASGACQQVAQAARALAAVAPIATELAQAQSELAECELRLRDVASDLRSFLDALEAEPGRLELVEAKLERIADARRRFRAATLEQLLERRSQALAELAQHEQGDDPLAQAEAELAAAEGRHEQLVRALAAARREAAPLLEGSVTGELAALGMGEGELRVVLEPREAGPVGRETARFEIRPNRGLPFAPLAQTASGGELSRIALALRTAVLARSRAPEGTVVFDEIDAGVGGRTAHAVAEALGRLARRTQVITITHLPQIASSADSHFVVEKVAGDPTRTTIEQLDEGQRRAELERMLGGAEFLETIR